MNLIPILQEVNLARRRENYANVLKFLGVSFLVFTLGAVVAVLADPEKGPLMIPLLVVLGLFATISFVFNFLSALWPFLLYWWGNVQTIRQKTLLSLIQTSIETDTPLQNIVRAYAATCVSRYAKRLEKFAAALDAGKSLEEAVREHWGLFRYDVAGIVRLGGNDPETLRSLETVAQDERDFAVIKTNTLIRIVYLCFIAAHVLLVLNFLMIQIVPQFEAIFRDFDVNLPTMTLCVISVSQVFVSYWYLGVPLMMLIGLALLAYLVLQTDCIVFRPWGLRRLFRSTDSAKFLLVFATGIRRRFPIPAILKMYAWTVPSDYLRRKGMKIRSTVESGGDWIDAVCRAGFVNGPEASLLRSAQRTGNTAAVLDQLAHSKERSQMRKDDLFSKLAFIPLVFLLAAVIGFIVIGMFMPLVTLIVALT
jgi:type II secretory pathway component PulF